jgi:hypothetical protein
MQKKSYTPFATASGMFFMMIGFGMFPSDMPLKLTLTFETNPVETQLAPAVSQRQNKSCIPDERLNVKPSERRVLIAVLPMKQG